MKDHLIQIKKLTKRFPFKGTCSATCALSEIDLAIPKGSVYGIIGMSGAGKSTLLRCLTGLDIPCAGSISFDGQEFPYDDSKALAALRKQMGMVFQQFHLFSSRTVSGNIGYPLEIAGVPQKQRQQRIDELLALIGLQAKKNHYPSQLSGGEKQRVGIARALATHPQLLFCDEPTSALDCKTTRDLLQLLSHLNQTLGLTIVIITHQLEVVKQTCGRVAVLDQGKIVEEGKVKEIFTKPQHPATQRLLHLGADQIPAELLQKSEAGKTFVRLAFEGNQAKAPVLSQMIKRYDIEANILSGGLDYLQETVVGHLFVELSGPAEEMNRALTFLRSQQILCEVLQ